MLRTLIPPKNPKEAIESRRNACYGFTIIADIQENTALISILTKTRDEILNIVDPDRVSKKPPIKSPLWIKQKNFHPTIFGMPPLLEEKQFVEVYANKEGLLKHDTIDKMCDTLHNHLKEQKPGLEPVKCELMDDGTILARFVYKTAQKEDAPLLTLADQLDPKKEFPRWDPKNELRNKTVAVAICVIDKNEMGEKLDAIRSQLDVAFEQLKKVGNIDITQFQICSFNKRTLSKKHITHVYADIHRGNSLKFNE